MRVDTIKGPLQTLHEAMFRIVFHTKKIYAFRLKDKDVTLSIDRISGYVLQENRPKNAKLVSSQRTRSHVDRCNLVDEFHFPIVYKSATVGNREYSMYIVVNIKFNYKCK